MLLWQSGATYTLISQPLPWWTECDAYHVKKIIKRCHTTTVDNYYFPIKKPCIETESIQTESKQTYSSESQTTEMQTKTLTKKTTTDVGNALGQSCEITSDRPLNSNISVSVAQVYFSGFR